MTLEILSKKQYICDKCGRSEECEDVPFKWLELKTRTEHLGIKQVHLCVACKDSASISELYVDEIYSGWPTSFKEIAGEIKNKFKELDPALVDKAMKQADEEIFKPRGIILEILKKENKE